MGVIVSYPRLRVTAAPLVQYNCDSREARFRTTTTMATTIADYSGQIGITIRGHVYLLEDVLEQETKDIEKQNGKTIKELVLGLDQAKTYIDQVSMKEHKERRRISITETKGFLNIEKYSGETNETSFASGSIKW
eukprot:3840579-Heterocapsa_arctica.AAC.1